MNGREYRVLVTGGRDFNDADQVAKVIERLKKGCSERNLSMTLIHGAARGADLMCAFYAAASGVKTLPFPADWDGHGKAAGHIRNKQMLDEGRPHICIAFPGGRGTANMVEQCKSRLVLVVDAANVEDVFP